MGRRGTHTSGGIRGRGPLLWPQALLLRWRDAALGLLLRRRLGRLPRRTRKARHSLQLLLDLERKRLLCRLTTSPWCAIPRQCRHVHQELLHSLESFLTNLARLNALHDRENLGDETRVALLHLLSPTRVVDVLQVGDEANIKGKLGRVDTRRWPYCLGSSPTSRHPSWTDRLLSNLLSLLLLSRLLTLREISHGLRQLLLLLGSHVLQGARRHARR